MCITRPEDTSSTEELKTRLILVSHLARMEETS